MFYRKKQRLYLREDLSRDIEATRQDVEATRRASEARTRRAGGNSAGANADHIQTEAAHAFIDGIRDGEVKQHLLLGGDRTLNEALNQAMKLDAAKAAAWPTSRVREVTRVPTGRPPTPPERRRSEQPVCWWCGQPGHLQKYCRQRPPEEMGQVPRTRRGVSEPSITPGPDDAHQSTTRIDNVVHRVQGHLRAKMRVAHVGRLASYLGPARDEQP
jgi:ribosomal protein L34E